MTTSRGIRNHNPGNIDHNPANRWQGLADPPIELGVPRPRFARFKSAEWGIRALAVLLIGYQDRNGLDTVEQIIDRWAPPVENNTSAYVREVARAVGVAPDQRINVHDYATLRALVLAIIKHENGVQPYRDATIDHGLRLAGVVPPKPKPMTKSKTVIGTAIAATAGSTPEAINQVQPLLAEAGVALEPLSVWSPWIRLACVVLVFAGAALAIYGRLDVRDRTGA